MIEPYYVRQLLDFVMCVCRYEDGVRVMERRCSELKTTWQLLQTGLSLDILNKDLTQMK